MQEVTATGREILDETVFAHGGQATYGPDGDLRITYPEWGQASRLAELAAELTY